jgi:ribosomal protein L16/L10AE
MPVAVAGVTLAISVTRAPKTDGFPELNSATLEAAEAAERRDGITSKQVQAVRILMTARIRRRFTLEIRIFVNEPRLVPGVKLAG